MNEIEHLEPLRKLRHRYILQEILGGGSYGTVFRADDPVLERSVAVKLLTSIAVENEEAVRQFEREAKLMARIRHPNVVQVVDFGREDNEWFIVMELVGGKTLDEVVALQFPLAAHRISDISDQILAALEEAHALQIVHRDLKPQNIMVEQRRDGKDSVKVLDLGIAILINPEERLRQADSNVVGTPGYMSPEQWMGLPVDPRSDIFSFGCILYLMLSGEPPFSTSTDLTSALVNLGSTPTLPSRRVSESAVPPGLEQLAMWCLSKEPDERPQTIRDLRQELASVVRNGYLPIPRSKQESRSLPATVRRSIGTEPPMLDLDDGEAKVAVVANDSPNMVLVVNALYSICNSVEVMTSMPLPASLAKVDILIVGLDNRGLERISQSARNARVPFLVFGSDGDMAAMAGVLEQGAHDFIPLPVDVPSLRRSLDRALKAKRRMKIN